jgi:hypothetical protein
MEPIEQPTALQLARRKANRLRKQVQRAKDRARSDRAVLAYLDRVHARQVNADGLAWQQKRNLCTLGEVAPGADAKTIDEALEVAREFARALVIHDVQEGESLLDFERRVFDAWVTYDKFVGRDDAGGTLPGAGGGGAPYLNQETGELYPGHGKAYWVDHLGGFDRCWTLLPGAKEKIDIASLPKLKKRKVPEEHVPEAKAVPPPPTPITPHEQPNAIHFSYISPDAYRYLNGSLPRGTS